MTPPTRRLALVCSSLALVTSGLIVYGKDKIRINSTTLNHLHYHRSQSLSNVYHRALSLVNPELVVTISQQQPQQLQELVVVKQPSTAGTTLQRKQLEFVHITKTGGSAIERAAAYAGINWGACRHYLFRKIGCLEPPDLPYNASEFRAGFQGKPFFGESWHCPHHWMTPNPHRSKATFCVIRNPYDRYVSEYGYMEGTISGQALDATAMNDFIQARIRQFSTRPFWPGHFLPMHYYIYNEAGKQVIDHILRYENLQDEFNALMDAYQLDIVLPSKRIGVDGSLFNKSHLSPNTIAAINEYAKRDFELFGYKMVTSAAEFT